MWKVVDGKEIMSARYLAMGGLVLIVTLVAFIVGTYCTWRF